MELPTVKIVHESVGYVVINESDYDPATMKLYKEPTTPKTKKSEEQPE